MKHLRSWRVTLNFRLCALFLVLAAAGLTFAMLMAPPIGLSDVLTALRESGFRVFFLNFWPVLLTMVLLFFVSGKLVVTIGTAGFFFILLSVINRYKMIFRHDPFVPWDIMLGGEFLGIARSLEPSLIAFVIGGIVGFVLLCAVAFVFIKHRKLCWRTRLVGGLLTAVIMAVSNATIYHNSALYDSLPVNGNVFNQMAQFNSKGFLYSFIYTANTGRISRPPGYDRRNVARLIAETETFVAEAAQRPHVFLILGEAFSEMPLNPILSYEGFTHPMEHYLAMRDESISGHIVVPNIGGGTANTEFDILTGMNTRQFRGAPHSNALITRSQYALPRIMVEHGGYRAIATHPGYAWFYNRQNVLPFLGFESFTTIEAFGDAPLRGMYVCEEATYDRVIADFHAHLAENPGVPLFSFVITIQNHGPYIDKYGADLPINFHSQVPFSERDANAFSHYLHGMADMDAQLARLVAEVRFSDEPVVIAYFGDHLPSFEHSIYELLLPNDGTEADRIRRHRTPYLIWANEAAQPLVNEVAGGDMSALFFGAALLDFIGLGQADPFFAYINAMREHVSIILEDAYYTSDGVLQQIADTAATWVDHYMQWSYFRIFG